MYIVSLIAISRDQSTKYITILVDFDQSIPRIISYDKFCKTCQVTHQVIACPPALQNNMGIEHIESKTITLEVAKWMNISSVISISHECDLTTDLAIK